MAGRIKVVTVDDQVPGDPSPASGQPPSFTETWRPAPETAAAAAAVVVEFQLTEDDVVPGLRRQLLRGGRLRFLFALGVLLILVGALLALANDASVGGLFGFIGVFYVALICATVVLGPRRAWRRNPMLRGPQYMAFSPDGVYARSIAAESRSQWLMYVQMIETHRTYLLRLATRKAYVSVPKRAFKSATDEAAFRNMVALHMRVDQQRRPRHPPKQR